MEKIEKDFSIECDGAAEEKHCKNCSVYELLENPIIGKLVCKEEGLLHVYVKVDGDEYTITYLKTTDDPSKPNTCSFRAGSIGKESETILETIERIVQGEIEHSPRYELD